MGDFLTAAHRVLSDEHHPLTAADLTDLAILRGYLVTEGATPWQTMKARLSDEIRKNRSAAIFMRTARGMFALREWKTQIPEYHAERYTKALLDEDAVVFDRDELPRVVQGSGYQLNSEPLGVDFLSLCRPMQRRIAEEDPTVIQLVSAFIVQHGPHILTYKRTARLPESRLHGQYSAIFGGHLTPHDLFGTNEWPSDPSGVMYHIFDKESGYLLLQRELDEELRLARTPSFEYLGLLYDDSRPVSTQHLGIVWKARLRSSEYEIGERGFLTHPQFETREQIIARAEQFENWSVALVKGLTEEDPDAPSE